MPWPVGCIRPLLAVPSPLRHNTGGSFMSENIQQTVACGICSLAQLIRMHDASCKRSTVMSDTTHSPSPLLQPAGLAGHT